MKEIGASVKEAIVNQVATSTNKIKDEIKTSYANAVSRSDEISSVELKSVVTEARFAEQKEEIDRKNCSNKIFIHRVQESQNNDKNKDKEFVNNLTKSVKATVTIKDVFRIGQHGSTGRTRPIKVILKSGNKKFTLLGNLFALKGVEEYNIITITEDLTQTERTQYDYYLKKQKIKTINCRMRIQSFGEFVEIQKRLPLGELDKHELLEHIKQNIRTLWQSLK